MQVFDNDMSLFFVVHNVNISVTEISYHLNKICEWAHQWKIRLNLNPSKQTQEGVVSRKLNKESHLPLTFVNNIVY